MRGRASKRTWKFERKLEEDKGGETAKKYVEEMKERWKKRRKMGARKKEIYGRNGSGNMRGGEIEIRGTRRKGEQETGTGKDRKDCGVEI